jgi:hypothetical protein
MFGMLWQALFSLSWLFLNIFTYFYEKDQNVSFLLRFYKVFKVAARTQERGKNRVRNISNGNLVRELYIF